MKLFKTHRKRTILVLAICAIGASLFVSTATASAASSDQGGIGNAVVTHGFTPAARIWHFRSHDSLPKHVGIVKARGSWLTTSFRTLLHRVTCTPLLATWRCSANHNFFVGKIDGRPHMRDIHVIGHLLRRIPLKGYINKRTASYCFRVSLHRGPVKGSFWNCPLTYPPYGPVD